MRVAVIGGAGFVGYHLVGRLLEEGHSVLVYDNLSARGDAGALSWRDDVRLITGDIGCVDCLRDALQAFEPDVLYHLAAIHYIPQCEANPTLAARVNVAGTRNVVQAAAMCKRAPRIVFTSSAAVYTPSETPHDELSQIGPVDVYGHTKVEAEKVLRSGCEAAGIAYAIIRLFNVYGHEETTPHLIPAIVDQVRDGGAIIRMGRADTFRTYIHATDVASALTQLGVHQAELPQVVNIAGPEEATAADLVGHFAAILGRKLTIATDANRMRPQDRPYLRADLTLAKTQLNWTPQVSLRTGLQWLLQAEDLA